MSKILLSILSLFILLISALLVIPSFIDWSQYKDQIKEQVANATGYKLDLNGELRAAFLPYPHVTIKNVSIDSAGVKGPFAFQGKVEEASVSLALVPLLSGKIAISDVTLISPELSLQQQAEQNNTGVTDETTSTDNSADDASSASKMPDVQVEQFRLEKAKITYKPVGGEAMLVEFPKLELQADTLFGPYRFDGSVVYNDMTIGFEGTSGEYSKQEVIPVTVKIAGEGFNFGYSGVADLTKDIAEFQGELSAGASSLQALVTKAGGSALPIRDQSFSMGGLLKGSQQAFELQNGTFVFGSSKGKVTLSASGLDTDVKAIDAGLIFDNALNLDDILQTANKSVLPTSVSTAAKTDEKEKTYDFLPDTMELPAGIKAHLSVTVPQIQYNGKSIENASVSGKLDNGKASASIKADNLSGGGSVNMSASLNAVSTSRNGSTGTIVMSNPAVAVNGHFSVNSLQAVAVDWLKLVEASVFDNPQVPKSASGEIGIRVQGAQASVSSSALSLGQYDMKSLSLAYQNAADPSLELSVANFEGATITASGTLDQSKGIKVSVSHPNAAQFIQVFKPDLEAAPNLQQSFAFAGTVLKDGDAINVSGMTAKVGSIDATGNLSVNTGGSVPDVKADIAFGNLDTRALLTGKKSTATASGSGVSSSASATKSTSAPWTRDAIDTSFMRSMNVELSAKAQQLVHGTWLITSPVIDMKLRDGVLAINKITGGLFDGSVDLSGRVEAKQEGQPLSATLSVKADSVDLNRLVQAALAQSKQRVAGTGSFTVDLKTSGLSSSALVYALNGNGTIKTSDLIVYGLDLGKVTEAISDESLTDLATVVQGAFQSGQTKFQPVDHSFTISEGTMPVNNFKLVSDTAQLVTNGEVSFASWQMNLKNTVDFIGQFDDLPSVEMTIKGPLNAPEQNVANDVLKSFLINKYGSKVQNKVQKLIDKKLGGDSAASGLINNLLGLPQQQNQTDDTTTTPASNDNTSSSSPQEQLLKGLINQLGR